ncbi:uncharacterized protein LOC126983678 [Eriocheir sinensis]|uniref:uncharacterized protein LOC126983678 n=1 Tax=Eriocheir sinensis TaxID=95602 RepID=UPI0021C92AEA|nr:uncharacterized protein LOC126983678 [Eriocheir sinensis]
MAALVTLNDLLLAHEGINGIIKTLYPHRGRRDEEEEGGRRENEEECDGGQPTITELSKVEHEVDGFLETVSALEEVREQLTLTLEQANSAVLTQASATLTHPQVLGRRVEWCVEAEQHMRTIVENKDLLIYHLQQPLVSTFLTMHHRYHRSLVSLVGALSDLLTRLHTHTDLLERHARHSALDTVDSLISSLTQAAATQRSVLGDITALHSLVASILQEQE